MEWAAAARRQHQNRSYIGKCLRNLVLAKPAIRTWLLVRDYLAKPTGRDFRGQVRALAQLNIVRTCRAGPAVPAQKAPPISHSLSHSIDLSTLLPSRLVIFHAPRVISAGIAWLAFRLTFLYSS
jgi:hypothetical protein